MLLTNRRHRLLYIALAAMEIGWIAPWALLLFDFWQKRLAITLLTETAPETAPGSASDALHSSVAGTLANVITTPPLLFYALLLGIMLIYMLAADLLNRRQIGFPQRELIMLALVVGTSLLAVRVILYPSAGLFHTGWLRNTISALFNFTAGRRPEVAILVVNGFLWLRVAINTDRDLTFFRLALNFRMGLLFAVIGNALLLGIGIQPLSATLVYFSLFLIAGLTAIAIARTEEKAYTIDSSRGSLLPWSRVMQMAAAGVVIVVLGLLASLLYTPGNLRGIILWFSPLWRLIGNALNWALFAVAWAMAPFMEWLINTIRAWMESLGPVEEVAAPPSAGDLMNIEITPTDITEYLNRMVYVRYGIMVLMILAVLVVIWFFFVRSPRRRREEEAEEVEAERMTFGGSLFGRGLDRLRNLADLIRRYGVSAQLLAAISIQNIYANVSRMALSRGYPRRPSLPPDGYLPALIEAFPGCEDDLIRITDAYMRVEYGDQSLADVELTDLQEAYRSVQDSPPLETE